jgi:hypothetical protein
MSTIRESITKSLQRAFLTFQTFPVVLASALGFTLVTLVRIWMDWAQQQPYNFLFNCLHLAFSMSAVFGLAAIAMVQERYNEKKMFLAANLAGAIVGLVAFLLLTFFGAAEPRISDLLVQRVSTLAAARISVAIFISFIGFIYFAGKSKDKSDFARSLFMTQKAILIAALYGGVMMAGASGITGSIQALLYRNMSSKVYMVLAALIGFVAFAIFVGYFPDFRKNSQDTQREVAQKQPRFIEVLFEFIMVPILLILTTVLLSWAVKTIITGDWPTFSRLFGIVSSYSIGGIWLAIMIAKKETDIARLYHRIYPIALLVILVFGLWALILQLNVEGLRSQEYYFALLLLAASTSGVLLIMKKEGAHAKIAALICIMAVVSVSPWIGGHILPARIQLSRLQTVLVNEGMLVDNQLIPAGLEPSEEVRIAITEGVNLLAYEDHVKLPEWFDKDLSKRDVFESKMGFEQTWKSVEDDYPIPDPGAMGVYLTMPSASIDISEYDWAIYLKRDYEGPSRIQTVEGKTGTYRVEWIMAERNSLPSIKIWMDDELILEENLKAFMDETAEAVGSRPGGYEAKTFEEMSLIMETPEISVLMVFNNMNIYANPREDIIDYNLDLNVLYLKEK